jgi:hypothetical protein
MWMMGALKVEATIVVNGDFENLATFNANWNPTVVLDPLPPNSAVSVADPAETIPRYGLTANSGSIATAFASDSNAPAGSMASISQSLLTDASKTYTLHFWIENTAQISDPRQNLFSVRWDGNLLNLNAVDPRFKIPDSSPGSPELYGGGSNQFVLDPTTTWVEIVIPDLNPNLLGPTVLKFEGQNNNWVTLVDDVLVEETPEPSTVVMLGAGALLMGLRRRRQHRSS